MRLRHAAVLFLFTTGCDSVATGLDAGDAGTSDVDLSRDVGLDPDAPRPLDGAGDAGIDGGTVTGIAPVDAIPGELAASGDTVLVSVSPTTPAVIRIEAEPTEHITFFFTFSADAAVELEVLRWDGRAPISLGLTDAGPGVRTLAVFDPSGPRTFWARVTSDAPIAGSLAITRVPFEDVAVDATPTCSTDCAHLLQLPLPNDPALDGYDSTSSTVFRYQYGRRDLLMFIRHAGHRMVALGMMPFIPEDLSQWNGETPGIDVGSPRHASHQRGKDVDISLYGDDGVSRWRSYCTTMTSGGGRECVSGSEMGYDGEANAIFFGDFLASGRVTMSFLDQELHPATIRGAASASPDPLPAALVPLFSDGVHLQHWPNHDNHIHIRVSETAGAMTLSSRPEPFEPP